MVEGIAQEWFLEVEGSWTGPFSTEDILGFLKDGEIPETEKIYPQAQSTSSITVAELAQRQQAASAPKPFVPPPRPAELQPGSPPANDPRPNQVGGAPKPELSLLDALIAAKERKANATRAIPPAVGARRPNPFKLGKIPRKAWAMVGTAVALVVAAWGMAHFIKERASSIASAPTPAEVHPQMVPPPGSVAAVPPPAPIAPPPVAAAPIVPPPIAQNGNSNVSDADREREREREEAEREREREREREVASVADGTAQPPVPPPPPGPGMIGGLTPDPNMPATGPGAAVPPPPGQLPETPGVFMQEAPIPAPPVPPPPPIE